MEQKMRSNIIKSVFLIGAVIFLAIGSSGAYYSDTATVTGNSFTTGTWVTNQNIVINEVYYDTDGRHFDNGGGTKAEVEGKNEWVELYNPNDVAVNIKDYSVTDNTSPFVIHSNSSIPAHGFVILTHDNDTKHFWGDPAVEFINLGGNMSGGWLSNEGDKVILKNVSGVIVDQMSYGTNITVFNPACPDVSEGHSLERNPLGKDTNLASDFIDRATPTPGA
jgi:predicted ribosomally synthesized peptide with SipW-like signal peptide